MPRPSVQINTANQVSILRRHLEERIPQFSAFPGVVGLTLNGGLSRGYADHLSEIDVTFYLTPEAFETWNYGVSPIATGITMLDGQLYDVKLANYVVEMERIWDDDTLWDASYAEILYDPLTLLHQLYADKLNNGPDLSKAEGLLMSCWWYFELAGEIWIHRGDVLQGHHMFNQAVISLVQALFVANQEYIPHEKWLLHMSRSLEWRPTNWEKLLTAALATGDMTIGSLRKRQEAIRSLWEQVDGYIVKEYYPDLPVRTMQKSTYDCLKVLMENGSMSVSEWSAHTGIEALNRDPFYPVVRTNREIVELDRDALLKIGPEDMYYWHYAIVRALIE